jgi:hypothetical protein
MFSCQQDVTSATGSAVKLCRERLKYLPNNDERSQHALTTLVNPYDLFQQVDRQQRRNSINYDLALFVDFTTPTASPWCVQVPFRNQPWMEPEKQVIFLITACKFEGVCSRVKIAMYHHTCWLYKTFGTVFCLSSPHCYFLFFNFISFLTARAPAANLCQVRYTLSQDASQQIERCSSYICYACKILNLTQSCGPVKTVACTISIGMSHNHNLRCAGDRWNSWIQGRRWGHWLLNFTTITIRVDKISYPIKLPTIESPQLRF